MSSLSLLLLQDAAHLERPLERPHSRGNCRCCPKPFPRFRTVNREPLFASLAWRLYCLACCGSPPVPAFPLVLPGRLGTRSFPETCPPHTSELLTTEPSRSPAGPHHIRSASRRDRCPRAWRLLRPQERSQELRVKPASPVSPCKSPMRTACQAQARFRSPSRLPAQSS